MTDQPKIIVDPKDLTLATSEVLVLVVETLGFRDLLSFRLIEGMVTIAAQRLEARGEAGAAKALRIVYENALNGHWAKLRELGGLGPNEPKN